MAMFTRSPALQPTRPPGLIDPHLPAEYSVFLGEAFNHSDHGSTSLSLRYNWKAQKSSPISKMHVTKTKPGPGDAYDLTIEDRLHKDQPYRYTGQVTERSSGRKGENEEDDSNQSLALVWDPAKSAFILEPLSASLDFDLTSAPDQTQREVDAHKKLQRTISNDAEADSQAPSGPKLQYLDSDSDPDANNPYDFRHFLAEARENVSNATKDGRRTPVPGSRTPLPGSRTPLPGLSSPALGAAAKTSTPQIHATSGPSPLKKRKPTHSPNPIRKPKSQPTAQKSADAKRTQPLSSERIIDSDSDSEPEVPLASTGNHRKALSPLIQGQTQKQSSPHLIVSDADAALEIDLGSPPAEPEKFTQRKRVVNPAAFRRNVLRRASPSPEPAGLSGLDKEGDVEMTDADVEELRLGSPKARTMSTSTHVGRIEMGDITGEEEDDDGLAAELAAALEEEEEGEEVVGLGISGTKNPAEREDESEVSEEE
jgi:hypothetical protein